MVSSSFLSVFSTTLLLLSAVHGDFPDIRSTLNLYAIAHKVLDNAGVDAAIKHGANALEMDMTAWKEGWWCDHDGTANSWHASTEDQFKYVASKKAGGANLQWIWLDIKTPDFCDLDDSTKDVCSIKGLQKLARDILHPAGVRTLYGFGAPDGKAFKYVRGDLTENEAINEDNSAQKTPRQVLGDFGDVKRNQKIGSYGDDDLFKGFGDCTEPSKNTCTELRIAKESGHWGKVFGWTVAQGQDNMVDKMFGQAKVDGTIYGHEQDLYNDDQWTQAAAKSIHDWIDGHGGYGLAQDGNPWVYNFG